MQIFLSFFTKTGRMRVSCCFVYILFFSITASITTSTECNLKRILSEYKARLRIFFPSLFMIDIEFLCSFKIVLEIVLEAKKTVLKLEISIFIEFVDKNYEKTIIN